ncbi:MAG: hypothetical protein DWQ35_02730 [Planctomycetota bacterium]|nr:MAG: hypothetical protein DWQ35_02730 [Planctomycetota bacterium]
MLAKLARTALSFAVVVVAYWSYALAVVPWIEPEAEPIAAVPVGGDDYVSGTARREPILDLVRPFLPEGAWELTGEPIILGSDQFTLLIPDYNTDEQDKLRLDSCTLVFFPDGEPTKANPTPSVIVLRAPEGAVLTFADGVDLSRLKMGKMQSGLLTGEVTIDGVLTRPSSEVQGDRPGEVRQVAAESQRLLVRTRDVQLTDDRIWTDAAVQFALGESRGSGRRLVIEMTEIEEIQGARTERKRSVKSIEISEQVALQLAMTPDAGPLAMGQDLGAEADIVAQPAGVAAAVEQAATAEQTTDVVEITCQGPFRFDALSLVATFEQHVDVKRNAPQGAFDHLACALLSVFFARSAGGQMEPRRVEAAGFPVIGKRVGEDAELRCEHLVYHLDTGTIALKSDDRVRLRRGDDIVEASEVQYQTTDSGAIGELLAAGRGFLRAKLPGNDDQRVAANWTKELRLRPHEGQKLLSVLGEAQVEFGQLGKLASDEIWLWLSEQPVARDAAPRGAAVANAGANAPVAPEAAAPKMRLAPKKMLAQGRVSIHSPQMQAVADRLEMWFVAAKLPSPVAAAPVAAPAQPPPGVVRPGQSPAGQTPGGQATRSIYQVSGQVVRVQVATDGAKNALRDVTIEGNVELREKSAGGTSGLSVRGESLELVGADAATGRLKVRGDERRPARIEARGMVLSGQVIEGNKASNTLEINGPGWMTLPLKQDLLGQAATAPLADRRNAPRQAATPVAGGESLRLDWRERMRFDGQRVTFDGDVVARTPAAAPRQELRTTRLIATLTRDVDFAAPGRVDDLGLAMIQCPERATLASRTIVERQLQSVERLEVANLRFNQTSGHLEASGPGWIKTHRFGSPVQLGGAPGANRGAAGAGPAGRPGAAPGSSAAAANDAAKQLTFLRVDFEESMTGSLRSRQLTFQNQVRCIYGPVRDWQHELDTHGFNKPGPRDVLLTCDRLTVLQQAVIAGQKTFDLDAVGNMEVDGEQFTARGHRLSYNTGKELLTIEGTAQSAAQLWWTKPGARDRARTAADKIWYWRASNRVKVDGAQFLNVTPGGR